MITIIFIVLTPFFLYFIYWMLKERELVKSEYYGGGNNTDHSYSLFERQPYTQIIGLSPSENKAYESLSQIEGETIWHITIRVSLAKKSSEEFRKLISQIRTEAAPAPQVMVRIIGKKAYDAVMNAVN